MFVRLYVNAKSELEAILVVEKVLTIFQPILKSKETQKLEPYWKIDGVYVVEITMLISEGKTEEEINEVFMRISDNWIRFGNPANELLASDTTENCKFLLDGLKMINIHFESAGLK